MNKEDAFRFRNALKVLSDLYGPISDQTESDEEERARLDVILMIGDIAEDTQDEYNDLSEYVLKYDEEWQEHYPKEIR